MSLERRALVVLGGLAIVLGVLMLAGIVDRTVSELIVDTGAGSVAGAVEQRYPRWLGVGAVLAGAGMIIIARRRGNQG